MSKTQRPTVETERLILRPFTLNDAPEVQRLANDRDISSNTNLAYPYEDGMAEQWINSQQGSFERGEIINFAITHGKEGYLIGSIGLVIDKENEKAELGYWIGKPYWNKGYCTEAARAVANYGFMVVGLNRIFAKYFSRNPASGRVMQKIGMKHEGTLRQDSKKNGIFEDHEYYGLLNSDWNNDT